MVGITIRCVLTLENFGSGKATEKSGLDPCVLQPRNGKIGFACLPTQALLQVSRLEIAKFCEGFSILESD